MLFNFLDWMKKVNNPAWSAFQSYRQQNTVGVCRDVHDERLVSLCGDFSYLKDSFEEFDK